VRAAIRAEWRNARYLARTQLGDETAAHSLMEQAIDQTREYLADGPPVNVEKAREALARFYRNAVRRRRRADNKLSYRGTGPDIEILAPDTNSAVNSVDAALDLDTILRDTPADLRLALLMRYGARSRWEEVGEELSKSKDAIRMELSARAGAHSEQIRYSGTWELELTDLKLRYLRSTLCKNKTGADLSYSLQNFATVPAIDLVVSKQIIVGTSVRLRHLRLDARAGLLSS
jgi:hypothetical protein